MHPIIGVTGNEMSIHRTGDVGAFAINYSPRHFTLLVEENGGVPLIIPISLEKHVEQYVKQIDGLLLAGGQDISPQFYGEEPRKVIGETSLQRDSFEIALIKATLKQNKPILAVCRGMQLVNIIFGGTLFQDIDEDPTITIQHVQKSQAHNPTHSVNIEAQSRLNTIVGKPNDQKITVNSFHHQVIKDLGEELHVTGRSVDNVIEAFESANNQHDIIGVQWHPEYLSQHPGSGKQLFADLVERARLNKQNTTTVTYQ